jgi:hypothetical protein
MAQKYNLQLSKYTTLVRFFFVTTFMQYEESAVF